MEYDAKELSESTQGYNKKKLLGRGGFGAVYRGQVRGCLDIAVKVLTHVSIVDIIRYNTSLSIIIVYVGRSQSSSEVRFSCTDAV